MNAVAFVRGVVLLVSVAMATAARQLQQVESMPDEEQHGGQDRATDVSVQPFIVGGEITAEGRFPYICSLRTNTHLHRCGCALVDKWWILTAAHCVDPKSSMSVGLNPVTYIGGWDIEQDENSNSGIEVVRPKKTFMHPAWNGTVQAGNDIALLQLEKASSHNPIALHPAENQIHTGQQLVALGWGSTEDGELSRFLRQAPDLEYISLKNCRKGFERLTFPNGVLCTYTEGQDTCRGDSGGPLIIADSRGDDVGKGSPALDLLVGITSYGPNPCAAANFPGVSTNVAHFREWIEDVMAMESPQAEVNGGEESKKEKKEMSQKKPQVTDKETKKPAETPIDAESEEVNKNGEKDVPGAAEEATAPDSAIVEEPAEAEDSSSTEPVQITSSSTVPADQSASPSTGTDASSSSGAREDIKFVTLRSSSNGEDAPDSVSDSDQYDEIPDSDQDSPSTTVVSSTETSSSPLEGPSDDYYSDDPPFVVEDTETYAPEEDVEVKDTTTLSTSWPTGFSYSAPEPSSPSSRHSYTYSYTTARADASHGTSGVREAPSVTWTSDDHSGRRGFWRRRRAINKIKTSRFDWIG